ncbi:MAG TPA: hypothetical protein VMV60_02295 [Thermoanaerobaculia bacterium]|nr:hypothetical protein [Thermoanaerobaculia bacterium]
MSMQFFTLGLSRLVPLLFAASAVLVAGRLVHDGLRPRHAAAARVAFAVVLLAGAAVLIPWVRRGVTLLAAERAFWRSDWATAAERYADYARLGGSSAGRPGARRALALMNLRRFAEAESAFLASFPRAKNGTFRANPNDVLSLGLCRYYTGRLDDAERTVRAVAPGVSPVRDYTLGRILDRRGDPGGAVAAFRSSLAQAPCFYPALYHLVRTLRRVGRAGEARAAAAAFCPAGAKEDRVAREALLAGEDAAAVPPEKEFYFVEEN